VKNRRNRKQIEDYLKTGAIVC